VLSGKGEKKLEGISVREDGVRAHAPDVGQIVIEKLMDAGGELHRFHSCHRVKSHKFLRLFASAILRYTEVLK
jgi:hypothetical protein